MLVVEDIKIITLFTLAFFSIFLFSYRKGNSRANFMLASIYGFQALEMLNGTFYRFADFWMNDYPWVFYTTEFSFFLWGPAIYFFFRLSIKPDLRLTKKDFLHVIPAIVHTIFLTAKFHIYPNAIKTDMLHSMVMTPAEDFIIHFLRNSSVVIYLVICGFIISKSHIILKKRSWLRFFLIAFVVVEIIQILHFIDLETRIYNTIIYNTTAILWFVVAITTLYKALQNPHKLSDDYFDINEKRGSSEREKSIMDKKEFEAILNKIKNKIIVEEKYLDAHITLQKLSEEIEVKVKKTSFVINEHFKQNVSDFINSYRIEKAKKILKSPTRAEKNIIEIAYSVGFNSKATFNRAFHKHTQFSPTEYQKQQVPKSE